MNFFELVCDTIPDLKDMDLSKNRSITCTDLKAKIYDLFGFSACDFYFIHNGKLLNEQDVLPHGRITAVPRLVGGKGGFGSMLRAIGAQIEKTTNREACRDLSGRRLRDINEEKRLKNWIAQHAEREREANERRLKKLERLCSEPKHVFNDEEYNEQRGDLEDRVRQAVEEGIKVHLGESSSSSQDKKRKIPSSDSKAAKKKKKKLYGFDSDEDVSSSDCTDEESNAGNGRDEESKNVQKHREVQIKAEGN